MQTDPKQELERLVAEAEQANAMCAAEAERLRRNIVSPDMARAYLATRRSRFWRMPTWLWVPIVVLLVCMFVLALFAIGRR